jgi:transcriptional regulator with XRE-family HTH domain
MSQPKKQRIATIVGANITARRKLRGWNQAEFAEKMGIGADSLSRIERGFIAPRFQRLEQLAEILECSVADLFMTQDDISKYQSADTNVHFVTLDAATRSEITLMAEKIIQLMR